LRFAHRHVLRRKTRGQAAQKQTIKAKNGLWNETSPASVYFAVINCTVFTHKLNYTKKNGYCKGFFNTNSKLTTNPFSAVALLQRMNFTVLRQNAQDN